MVGYTSQNGRQEANELLAIELAAEYGIAQWIAALLDDAVIPQASEAPEKSISPPPKFKFTANDRTHLPPPNGTPARSSTPKSRGCPEQAHLQRTPAQQNPLRNPGPPRHRRRQIWLQRARLMRLYRRIWMTWHPQQHPSRLMVRKLRSR